MMKRPNSPSHLATLPPLAKIKDEAKNLLAHYAKHNQALTHSQALEKLARNYGFRNWNTFSAKLANTASSNRYHKGMRIYGNYLSQPFQGTILKIEPSSQQGHYHLTIQFDSPVDVVTFDSFSAFRQRVTCEIGPDGTSPNKTSNGKPHMHIEC